MKNVYALICGSNYQNSWLTDTSRNDALKFSQYMSNLGVPVNQVMVLLDNQYTRKNVMKELRSIARHMPSGSTAVLYFAKPDVYCDDNIHNYKIITDDELSYEFMLASDNYKNDPDWKIRVIIIADTYYSPSPSIWQFEDTPVEIVTIKTSSYGSQRLFKLLEESNANQLTIREIATKLDTIEVSHDYLWDQTLFNVNL